MKPRAWSHSALETHDNCPEMYRHKYILKDLPPLHFAAVKIS